ncbi:peptide/nickel transport system permease protein [Stella humosa]|uniref:Peptide/nickel transport system permease protein n=1 Tax=Stella humosa TaxID=94 RepID=A0A3N1LJ87_9PROT|nr:ABC transporter permease [Stella humosa]ROP90918.1 peptide/nickel transport system permease protein [Stella humosa]BBK34732.1 peptide ABC transporter permease [Stella humosa]
MLRFTLGRLGIAALVVLVVSIIVFGLTHVAADPARAMAGENATAADVAAIRKAEGFDRPLPIQYGEWISRVAVGDFGRSYLMKEPVLGIVAHRLPVTLTLGVMALAFALAVALPLGVLAAVRQNSLIDRIALAVAVLGQALPNFWFALVLIVVFGVWLQWLPTSGADSWEHMILPAVALGYYATPALMRLTRTGMLEALGSDYIRTARAKGLLPPSVLFKHALRNAVIPVVSLAAVQFGFMLGGSIVIEAVFSMHGVGYLAWESIQRSDLPVIQAIVLMISLFYVVLTFLADLLNGWLDPRLRVAGA